MLQRPCPLKMLATRALRRRCSAGRAPPESVGQENLGLNGGVSPSRPCQGGRLAVGRSIDSEVPEVPNFTVRSLSICTVSLWLGLGWLPPGQKTSFLSTS